jgi:flagellar motor switch protein FliM
MPDLDVPSTDAPSRRSSRPVPYDFRRPTKLSRETARTLEMAYETVARQWSTLVGSAISAPCQVTFEAVGQHSYDDYVSALESPTVLAVFNPEPHPGHGFLQLGLSTAYSCIDRMLGGPDGADQPQRTPTEIEAAVLGRLVERLLGELRYGLTAVTELTPRLRTLEYNPQFMQIAAATDLFVVARFTIAVGGKKAPSAPATVALPMSVLVSRPNHDDEDPESIAHRRAARAAMVHLVDDVPVDVSVRFASHAMSSTRILALRIGDVVPLHHPADRPLDVVASDVVCARGVAGTQGSRAACLIVAAEHPGKAHA